jgi:hypothetical protein
MLIILLGKVADFQEEYPNIEVLQGNNLIP